MYSILCTAVHLEDKVVKNTSVFELIHLVFIGFDGQINSNKKLADKAIGKLPGIEAIIQKAIADNTKTQDILDAMAVPYKDAQDTIDALKTSATQLEVWVI